MSDLDSPTGDAGTGGDPAPGPDDRPGTVVTPAGRLDRFGVKAAREQPGARGAKVPRQGPVEGTAVAARKRCVLRRLGVDQQEISDGRVRSGSGEVLTRGDADRLHRRAGGEFADTLDPRRSLAPVQLIEIGIEGVGDTL